MDTTRSLYEIETALVRLEAFSFIRNIVAFNVNGLGSLLSIGHECDVLVLSKSGYLTEIEIKRSYTDFLADLKKSHQHDTDNLIKYFYYCVPRSIEEKVYNKLFEQNIRYTGIINYDENLVFGIRGHRSKNLEGTITHNTYPEMHPYRKLFLEEQLQVARFGVMRAVMLKEKLIEKEEK